jgi:hypothetical protein
MKPLWFKCVACIIVYSPWKKKFFLGKRNWIGEEGGKWAVMGGVGAFADSQTRKDFAESELKYDLDIVVDSDWLEPFTPNFSGDQKTLVVEDYFYYLVYGKEIGVSKREKAPTEGRWFSLEEIKIMAQRGEIAFGNDKMLEAFNIIVAQKKWG